MENSSPFAVRKSPRIREYDYSTENYYFITVCTHNKACIFGKADALTKLGTLVSQELRAIGDHYLSVKVDAFSVMPNHIHAIIVLEAHDEKKPSLSQILAQFKSGVSRKAKKLGVCLPIWQRSFHDRIVRNRQEYEKIWNYVTFNHQKWEEDCFYPKSPEK